MKILLTLLTLCLALPAAAAENYPADVQRAFIESCVGLNKELVEPCKCILKRVQASVKFDEFEKRLVSGKLQNDPRIEAIAQQCTGK